MRESWKFIVSADVCCYSAELHVLAADAQEAIRKFKDCFKDRFDKSEAFWWEREIRPMNVDLDRPDMLYRWQAGYESYDHACAGIVF